MATFESKADEDTALFVEATQLMLERLNEIKERFSGDQEGLNHHTLREIQYWFRMSGKVNPHF